MDKGDEFRVVITGMGIVSPIGVGIPAFTQSLKDGKSGIGRISRYNPDDYPNIEVQIAGECTDFKPEEHFSKKELRRIGICTQLGLPSAIEAWEQSGLDMSKLNPYSVGIYLGTGMGGVKHDEDFRPTLEGGASARGKTSPFAVTNTMPTELVYYTSEKYGIKGKQRSESSACSSVGHALGDAYETLLTDHIIHKAPHNVPLEVIMVEGVEACLTPSVVSSFGTMMATTKKYNDDPTRASRPFDALRDGFVQAEGSCCFVMETYRHAKARGAEILAEVIGYGTTGDAGHITAPNIEGPSNAMHFALGMNQISPTLVDYINAHGTSTPPNDRNETMVIRNVFGPHADKLMVSSTKSMAGHGLGVSAGTELAATIACMRGGFVHPTINYENPDPECDLDYVPNEARPANIQYAMSNSFGFGGTNVCLLIKKV